MLSIANGDFFFHIPRCGGNYTIRTATALTINGEKVKAEHFGRAHGCPLEAKRKIKRSFAILRPVVDWYKSFYRFRIYKHYGIKKMDPGHALDFFIWESAGEPIKSFESFIRNVIKQYPLGYLTGLYCRFFPFVTDVLWLPDLTEALPALFTSWGYDTPVVVPPKPKNESPKDIPADCSLSTQNRLLNAERGIVNYLKKEFNYDFK